MKGVVGFYDDSSVDYYVEGHPEDCQVIYWVLSSMKQDFVAKDPNWLSDHINALDNFWKEVLEHRLKGTRPSEKKIASLDI